MPPAEPPPSPPGPSFPGGPGGALPPPRVPLAESSARPVAWWQRRLLVPVWVWLVAVAGLAGAGAAWMTTGGDDGRIREAATDDGDGRDRDDRSEDTQPDNTAPPGATPPDTAAPDTAPADTSVATTHAPATAPGDMVTTVVTAVAPDSTAAPSTPLVAMGPFTGVGAQVVQLPSPISERSLLRVTFTPEKESFATLVVSTLDESLAYNGLALFSFTPLDTATYVMEVSEFLGDVHALQIDSEGPWSIEVLPLADAPAFTGSASGVGPTVLRVDGAPGVYAYTNESTIIITTYGVDSYNYSAPVNDVEASSGTFAVAAGTTLVAIDAAAGWSITPAG